MNDTIEQRNEQRLNYNWPIRFVAKSGGALCQGKMVDISSYGSAFTCNSDENCPLPGQHISTTFSVPRFGRSEHYDMANYSRVGRVCRVDNMEGTLRRVAIQFTEPLFFKPGHQDIEEELIEQRLNAFSQE